jgi:DNA recombination protein RmuC
MQGMHERLDKATEALNSRLSEAARYMADVKREVGVVEERFKRFEEFNDLLHPKLRGIIGERILIELLAQLLPANLYETQFRFKNGETVDAIIKTRAGILPVDSKFPLDNFQQMSKADTVEERGRATKEFAKAVKRHIDDISKKYILPEEGTVNFAIMYVPSENVFYQILMDEENAVMEHAVKKNILLTSPSGFYFMIRIILMTLERERMQEQALKIWEILKGVQQETIRFRENLDLVSRHLTNAKSAMDTAFKGYDRLASKLEQIQLIEMNDN